MPRFAPGTGAGSRRRAAALLAVALAVGCATWEHAKTTETYAGRVLRARSAEGAERLRIESEYDTAVRQFVRTHGEPDYIYVVDRKRFYLFYVAPDLVAGFLRTDLPPGEVTKTHRIPGDLLRLLPEPERERILARRVAAGIRVTRAPQAPRRMRRPPPAPAAPAPSPGWSHRDFDVDSIVSRLRRPMSAADPGVSDWRRSALADGSQVRTGRSGSARYEVRPERVSVVASIGSGRRTPVAARVGYVRVNAAIFGARAEEVSRSVEDWVDRVSNDTSGRTRLARRIAGRTIQVTRVPDRGLLVYSVHTD